MGRKKSAVSKPSPTLTPVSGMIVGDYAVSVDKSGDIVLASSDGSRKIYEGPVEQVVQIRDALTHILNQVRK